MTFTVQTRAAGRYIPEALRERDIWVLWDGDDKTVKAPWVTGHMYPAEWTDDDGERVSRSYDKVNMVAELPAETLASSYPIPDGSPQQAIPTVLLPERADEYDPSLMLIDMDDVRDPETGKITREAAHIVGKLASYTEISSSGTGLHVYVWASLPGGLKQFIHSLNDGGDIEMYDHGRLSAATWQHVAKTPREITEAQDMIEQIIEYYAEDEQIERRDGREDAERRAAEVGRTSRSGGSTNAYYQLDTYDIARTDSAYATYESGGQGPHPAHGAQSGSAWDSESTNFSCERDGRWHCFLHGSGGGPLDLIAVLEGIVDCGYFASRRLEDDPEKLLAACVYARDEYASASLEGESPPYKVLLVIADEFDLATKADGSLKRDARTVAERIYDSMGVDDV